MRLVIVEDCDLVRETLSMLCTMGLGHSIVGETRLGLEAVEIIVQQQPDVVLLDLNLPDIDGLDVAANVQARNVEVRFLAMSGHFDDYTVARIEKARVQGFVDKFTTSIAVLREALNAVAFGGVYYSQSYLNAKVVQRADPVCFTKILTKQECRVLQLVGQGLSDREIALLLKISVRTAQTHRGNLLRKLNLHGTPKLMSYAIRHGITRIHLKDTRD